MSEVRLKRAYDSPAAADGTRILVDRLWPRGVKQSDAKIALWLKDVGPSTELRRWFAHDPAKWPEFQKRYAAELAHNPAMDALRAEVRQHGQVTLIFGARDTEHNNAVVLRDILARPPVASR
ncbi:DUF488 domain-containing protein [Limobrevibacterium gyesilva]|uniref:DUF488 domain-containing protein n=1 Tax=Limobrevibacterium gyesilva TaxID=2991712 RepID=A0AA41YMP3_9PROT|nr:DUF488 domain-containing protein [Limobrevibacterium gyesilva]MCW3476729.1 DUF488 domain-containing protein [Limobrevibacterium gyesilva]